MKVKGRITEVARRPTEKVCINAICAYAGWRQNYLLACFFLEFSCHPGTCMEAGTLQREKHGKDMHTLTHISTHVIRKQVWQSK